MYWLLVHHTLPPEEQNGQLGIHGGLITLLLIDFIFNTLKFNTHSLKTALKYFSFYLIVNFAWTKVTGTEVYIGVLTWKDLSGSLPVIVQCYVLNTVWYAICRGIYLLKKVKKCENKDE